MILLLFPLLVLPSTLAQTCADGASIGPDILGCNPGSVSINGECCPTASVIAATTLAGATAATMITVIGGVSTQVPVTSCVDRTNPTTGTSDCLARANLCTDPTYAPFMRQQCPKTCGTCYGATGTYSTCRDLINPSTGVSDCQNRTALCNDSQYSLIMRTQCPLSCGFCFSSTTSYDLSTKYGSTCLDRVNPSTGQSDCTRNRALCNDALYTTLMRQQCAKTCGFCSG